MNIYEKANMLAGQFNVVLILDSNQPRGYITLTSDEVRINPKDKPRVNC